MGDVIYFAVMGVGWGVTLYTAFGILAVIGLVVFGITLVLLGARLAFGAAQQRYNSRLADIALQAEHASREMHDLTLRTFISMSEAAEKRNNPHVPEWIND